mmetsp:Transcript_20310/g.60363  ORF Transcript_20310/g.60363 Transcript_20310/m.60363 type:complete len:86 (+) Transcript_20310:38-295(+)
MYIQDGNTLILSQFYDATRSIQRARLQQNHVTFAALCIHARVQPCPGVSSRMQMAMRQLHRWQQRQLLADAALSVQLAPPTCAWA